MPRGQFKYMIKITVGVMTSFMHVQEDKILWSTIKVLYKIQFLPLGNNGLLNLFLLCEILSCFQRHFLSVCGTLDKVVHCETSQFPVHIQTISINSKVYDSFLKIRSPVGQSVTWRKHFASLARSFSRELIR